MATPLTVQPEVLRAAAKLQLYRLDFRRFAREQLWIKPKPKPGEMIGQPPMPFRLNPPQQDFDAVCEQQISQQGFIRVVALKARQPGFSTYSEGRGFHVTALNSNVAALVVAQDDETAGHIFGITRLFYDHLTDDIRPVIRYSTKRELVFENPDQRSRSKAPGLRSRITFQTAKNIHAGTGQSLQVFHGSEIPKWLDPEQVMTSVFPAIPLAGGTSIILEGTAFPGDGGDYFRSFYERAKKDSHGMWRSLFVPWTRSPEYALPLEPGERLTLDTDERWLVKTYNVMPEQLKFRRYKIYEEGEGDTIAAELFKQEYPLNDEECWINTNLAVFDFRKLQEMKAHITGAPFKGDVLHDTKFYENPHGPLSIWEMPERGELYDLGCDVATGTEDGDWSVVEVIKRRTREQVAEYRAHITPIDFAHVIADLGTFYNTGQVGVEITGIGFATNEQLQKLGYPYIYIWRHRGHAVPKLSILSGWETSPKSKKLMVSLQRHLLMRDQLVFHSAVLWNEMRHFSVISQVLGEEYRGTSGCHDDCVMAYGIALVIADDESFGVVDNLPSKNRATLTWDEKVKQSMMAAGGAFREGDSEPSHDDVLESVGRTLRGWR